MIPQHSTNPAQTRLTSEIGRDRVLSGWYDRAIPTKVLCRLYNDSKANTHSYHERTQLIYPAPASHIASCTHQFNRKGCLHSMPSFPSWFTLAAIAVVLRILGGLNQ